MVKPPRHAEPFIRQVFIGRDPGIEDDLAFERKLYVIRRRAENAIRYAGLAGGDFFYVPSLSSKTLIYKGMLTPRQVATFYPDLNDALGGNRPGRGALALQHQYFPKLGSRASLSLYDSQRRDQHAARQRELDACAPRHVGHRRLFGDDIKKLFPIIQEDGSDSAMFDNCLEFLALSGRSLPHAMMMMIPEPWENHESMTTRSRRSTNFTAA